MNFDLSDACVRVMVCGGTVALGVVAGTLGLPVAVAGAVGAAAGIGSNMLAADLGEHLGARISDPAKLLANHDLRRLTAAAIGAVIRKEAKANPVLSKKRGALMRLARAAERRWSSLADLPALAGVSEPGVVRQVAVGVDQVPHQQALDERTWRDVLAWLQDSERIGGNLLDIKGLAGRLHNELPGAIRELVKHDFEHGGRAFAGLHLLMMGEIMAALATLVAGQADSRRRLEAIQLAVGAAAKAKNRVPGGASASSHGTFEASVKALEAELQSRMSGLSADLGGLRRLVERALADLAAVRAESGRRSRLGLGFAAAAIVLLVAVFAVMQANFSKLGPKAELKELALSVRSADADSVTFLVGVDEDRPQLLAHGPVTLGSHAALDFRFVRERHTIVLGLNPDGSVQCVYPASRSAPSLATTSARTPLLPNGLPGQFPLTDGVGLQTFLVIFSDAPLAPLAEWLPDPADLGWGPCTSEHVWFADGGEPQVLWPTRGQPVARPSPPNELRRVIAAVKRLTGAKLRLIAFPVRELSPAAEAPAGRPGAFP